jgi:hypothetical protein
MVTLILAVLAAGMPSPPEHAAQVIQLNGHATVTHTHPAASTEPLKLGAQLHEGDKVITGAKSTMRIVLLDQSVLDLGAETAVSIDGFKHKTTSQALVRLRSWVGKLWAHVQPREEGEPDFQIVTPNAVAGVRGTSFVVETDGTNNTSISTVSGHVQLYPGTPGDNVPPVDLRAMQGATLSGSTWPPSSFTVTPENVQQFVAQLTSHSQLSAGGKDNFATNWNPTRGRSAPLTLPLQTVPTSTAQTGPTVLNLDPGARLTHVHAVVQIQN